MAVGAAVLTLDCLPERPRQRSRGFSLPQADRPGGAPGGKIRIHNSCGRIELNLSDLNDTNPSPCIHRPVNITSCFLMAACKEIKSI